MFSLCLEDASWLEYTYDGLHKVRKYFTKTFLFSFLEIWNKCNFVKEKKYCKEEKKKKKAFWFETGLFLYLLVLFLSVLQSLSKFLWPCPWWLGWCFQSLFKATEQEAVFCFDNKEANVISYLTVTHLRCAKSGFSSLCSHNGLNLCHLL